jgi:hypothetical protein
MSLNAEIHELFLLIRKMEEKQKKGDVVSEQEVQNIKSLTLTLECVAESMLPEEEEEK